MKKNAFTLPIPTFPAFLSAKPKVLNGVNHWSSHTEITFFFYSAHQESQLALQSDQKVLCTRGALNCWRVLGFAIWALYKLVPNSRKISDRAGPISASLSGKTTSWFPSSFNSAIKQASRSKLSRSMRRAVCVSRNRDASNPR